MLPIVPDTIRFEDDDADDDIYHKYHGNVSGTI